MARGRLTRDLLLAALLFAGLCVAVGLLGGGRPASPSAAPLPAEALPPAAGGDAGPSFAPCGLRSRYRRCAGLPGWRGSERYELYGLSADGGRLGLATYVTLRNSGSAVVRGQVIAGLAPVGAPLVRQGLFGQLDLKPFKRELEALLRRHGIDACRRDCGPRANGRSRSPSASGSRVGTARGCSAAPVAGGRCQHEAQRRVQFVAGGPPARPRLYSLTLAEWSRPRDACWDKDDRAGAIRIKLADVRRRRVRVVLGERFLASGCSAGYRIEAVYEAVGKRRLVVVLSFVRHGKGSTRNHDFHAIVVPLP